MAVFAGFAHLHNNGEDDFEEEQLFRVLWEDETQGDVVGMLAPLRDSGAGFLVRECGGIGG